jgi:glutaredoxin
MKKKLLLGIILFIVLFAITGCSSVNNAVNNNTADQPNSSEIIFYYSNTCPHCKVVEEFINSNNIKEKVSFQSKEVGENKENASDLMAKAGQCKIAQDQIGVPFLWDGSKCVIGADEIINFFKNKTNVQ